MKQKNRQDILEKYKNYEKIIVGGESKNELLKNSLKHIAYAMSKAKHHVGVDSGSSRGLGDVYKRQTTTTTTTTNY